jgi:hypothetical protein
MPRYLVTLREVRQYEVRVEADTSADAAEAIDGDSQMHNFVGVVSYEIHDVEREKREPRIDASAAVGLLRQEWRRLCALSLGGDPRRETRQLLVYSRQIVSGLDDEEIVAIATGHATLEGVSPGPLEYKEVK